MFPSTIIADVEAELEAVKTETPAPTDPFMGAEWSSN
jgi:hypothetical protein